MPVRDIETDEQLLERLGTDPEAWASAYQRMPIHLNHDAMHIQLAKWFAAAIGAGRFRERYDLAINLNGISEKCPFGAKEIGAVLLSGTGFADFVRTWTDQPDILAEAIEAAAERSLYTEIGPNQADALRDELRSRGFEIMPISKGDER